MLDDETRYNLNKAVFMANEYSNRTIKQVAQMFQLPALEVNRAFWMAENLGYITVDQETFQFTVDMVPDEWDFGPGVDRIIQSLLYCLNHVSDTKDDDVEENFLMGWMMDYPTQDVFIAVKLLERAGDITTYKLQDSKGKDKNVYTFYTLAKNADKYLGKKQFKKPERVKVL